MTILKQEIKFWLLLLTTSVWLISCTEECTGKQVTCPAFNDELFLKWMPYVQNQEFIFTSFTTNDTFKIGTVNTSGSYEETVNGRRPFCRGEASFTSSSYDTLNRALFGVALNIDHNQFNNETQKHATINIKGSSFNGNGFADTGLIRADYQYCLSHFSPSATFNNKTYENIQEVYLDTMLTSFKSNDIYKLWIAKNIGIVGYEEYHGKLWVKQ